MKSGKSAAHQSMQNIRVPLSCPLIMGAVPLWGCSHSRELCHPNPATREGRTPHIRLLLSFRKRTNPGTWEECTLQHPCLGIVGPRISWPQPPLCLPDGLCPLPKGRGGWVGRCAWSSHGENHAWRAKSFCVRSAAWITEVKLRLSDRPCQNGKSSASKGEGLGTLRFLLQSLMETDIQRMLSIRPQKTRNGDDPEKQSSDSISLFWKPQQEFLIRVSLVTKRQVMISYSL